MNKEAEIVATIFKKSRAVLHWFLYFLLGDQLPENELKRANKHNKEGVVYTVWF